MFQNYFIEIAATCPTSFVRNFLFPISTFHIRLGNIAPKKPVKLQSDIRIFGEKSEVRACYVLVSGTTLYFDKGHLLFDIDELVNYLPFCVHCYPDINALEPINAKRNAPLNAFVQWVILTYETMLH